MAGRRQRHGPDRAPSSPQFDGGPATPALAQTNAGLVRVVMKTGKGLITLDLNAGKAPITSRNFQVVSTPAASTMPMDLPRPAG